MIINLEAVFNSKTKKQIKRQDNLSLPENNKNKTLMSKEEIEIFLEEKDKSRLNKSIARQRYNRYRMD